MQIKTYSNFECVFSIFVLINCQIVGETCGLPFLRYNSLTGIAIYADACDMPLRVRYVAYGNVYRRGGYYPPAYKISFRICRTP